YQLASRWSRCCARECQRVRRRRVRKPLRRRRDDDPCSNRGAPRAPRVVYEPTVVPRAVDQMQRKVLIVEGAAPIEDAVTGVLQRFDFLAPQTEPTVAAAANRLREEHFDLVLIPLDGTDAVDLAALERETRAAGSTAVIGTAAQSDANLILRALRSGVHEFLVYPPDTRELTSAVDRLVRRSAADRKQTGSVFAVYSGKGG